MARNEQGSENLSDRTKSSTSNPDLYFNIHDVGPNGRTALSWSGQGNQEKDAKFLDFSANPYGQQSDKFEKDHPWRAQVLNGAEDLRQEMRKDASHLSNHYEDIHKEILSIKNDEETQARLNGGELTANQKAELLKREVAVRKELATDYASDHRGNNGHSGKPGDPPGGGTPPPGDGSQSPGGSTPPPGDGSQPPGGSTSPPGDGSPPPGGSTPPIDDGAFMIGNTVYPNDFGAKSYQQGIQNFDARTGVKSNVQDLYDNENLPGHVPDLAAMQADTKTGITPMLSLRTTKYTDVISGKDDAYLKLVADDLKSAGGEVLLRPNWEMDGSNNQKYGSAADFKASWQYMHDFMEKQGVTNVKWVFTPNSGAYDTPTPSWAKPARDYYPGNDYVDYIGSDGYSGLNGAKYTTPTQVFQSGVDFARSQGKPFFIGEAGVSSTLGPEVDANYMKLMTEYLKDNPDIRGMAWFDIGNNNPFNSSQEAAAYIQMEKDMGGQPV